MRATTVAAGVSLFSSSEEFILDRKLLESAALSQEPQRGVHKKTAHLIGCAVSSDIALVPDEKSLVTD